jgi:hypothetical protein
MDRGRRRLGQPLARLTSAARTPGAVPVRSVDP